MVILDNCTDLWYLMIDFFHKHKCCNGFIDPKDPDLYAFMKNNYLFRIRRINNHDYRLRVIKQVKYKDVLYYQLKSLEEVENTILQYF